MAPFPRLHGTGARLGHIYMVLEGIRLHVSGVPAAAGLEVGFGASREVSRVERGRGGENAGKGKDGGSDSKEAHCDCMSWVLGQCGVVKWSRSAKRLSKRQDVDHAVLVSRPPRRRVLYRQRNQLALLASMHADPYVSADKKCSITSAKTRRPANMACLVNPRAQLTDVSNWNSVDRIFLPRLHLSLIEPHSSFQTPPSHEDHDACCTL